MAGVTGKRKSVHQSDVLHSKKAEKIQTIYSEACHNYAPAPRKSRNGQRGFIKYIQKDERPSRPRTSISKNVQAVN